MTHHDNHEPITEPIHLQPEHPQALNLDAIKRRVADAAMERVSGFDANQTQRIGVHDVSADKAHVIVHQTVSDERQEQIDRGNEVREMAKRPSAWLNNIKNMDEKR